MSVKDTTGCLHMGVHHEAVATASITSVTFCPSCLSCGTITHCPHHQAAVDLSVGVNWFHFLEVRIEPCRRDFSFFIIKQKCMALCTSKIILKFPCYSKCPCQTVLHSLDIVHDAIGASLHLLTNIYLVSSLGLLLQVTLLWTFLPEL